MITENIIKVKPIGNGSSSPLEHKLINCIIIFFRENPA
jgi:hypothetical protein